MIDSIRILNSYGVDETITFSDVSNGIKIKNITGLGPVKAVLNTSQKTNSAGLNYGSTNIGARNLVFSLGLSDIAGTSVEQLRQNVYTYFPIGGVVEMRFETSGLIRQIFGYVESTDPEIFTKDPGMQVSVICTDPYFLDYPGGSTVTLPANGSFANAVYQGRINNGVSIQIAKTVASPGGSIMGHTRVYQDATSLLLGAKGFNIEDFDLSVITGARLTLGDVINICTVQGKKSATLTRSGTVYNIIGAMKDMGGYYMTEAEWPSLSVGHTSQFKYEATTYDATELVVSVSWDTLIDGL